MIMSVSSITALLIASLESDTPTFWRTEQRIVVHIFPMAIRWVLNVTIEVAQATRRLRYESQGPKSVVKRISTRSPNCVLGY